MMKREEFRERYGQEAFDLFEQYMRLDQAARSMAEQLQTKYGVSVTSEVDVDQHRHQSQMRKTQPTLVFPATNTVVDRVNWSMTILELTLIALRAAGQQREPERQAFFTQRYDRVMIYHHLELLLDSLAEEARQPFLEELRRLIAEADERARQHGVYPESLTRGGAM